MLPLRLKIFEKHSMDHVPNESLSMQRKIYMPSRVKHATGNFISSTTKMIEMSTISYPFSISQARTIGSVGPQRFGMVAVSIMHTKGAIAFFRRINTLIDTVMLLVSTA